MNTFLLLVANGSAWSPEAWATERGGARSLNGQVTIERNANWLSVIHDETALDDFDEEDLSRISAMVGKPATYLVEWRGNTLVEDLLRSIPPNTRAVIDNDHGLLVSIEEIAGRPIDSWARVGTLPAIG
jgi:hypothetical protein